MHCRQIKKKFGKDEAIARLKRGSLKFRKSPSDDRFMEFFNITELNKATFAKGAGFVVGSEPGKKLEKKQPLELEGLAVSDLSLSSFKSMDVEPELQTLFGKLKMSKKYLFGVGY